LLLQVAGLIFWFKVPHGLAAYKIADPVALASQDYRAEPNWNSSQMMQPCG
jgi:hypothetical protein